MSLAAAITLLEEECLTLGLGAKNAPDPRTTRGYLLRAKCLALSSLRTLDAGGLGDDPDAVERWYKGQLEFTKPVSAERAVEAAEALGSLDVKPG